MHPNIELCLPALAKFARTLGWRDLVAHYHDADGLDVVWYTSGENYEGGDPDLFLQFNESPIGNTSEFDGAVYAIPHELWTGWHRFPLPDTDATLGEATARTDGWLNRKWFTEDDLRVQFISEHPECTDWDWERIRDCPPPHDS